VLLPRLSSLYCRFTYYFDVLEALVCYVFAFHSLFFECLLTFDVLMSDFMASLFGNLFPSVATFVHFSCCFALPPRFLSCIVVTFMYF